MRTTNKTPKSYATERYKEYYNNLSDEKVIKNNKKAVPSKSRQAPNTKTGIPSKSRQVQNAKTGIPSKSRQVPRKTTSVPTKHVQRKGLTHKNIKNVRIVKDIKPTVKYKYEIDKNNKLSFATWLSISVIFIGSIVCLYFNASITQKIQNINDIGKKTTKQGEINANLLVKISNSYDLINIERIASTKLGMSKPQEYQIISIDVPKESYIVQYSTKNEEAKTKKKFSFSSFKDFISIKGK